MKPLSPERAEVLRLRKELRLVLIDAARLNKLVLVERDAMHLSRAIVMGKLRRARVENAELRAQNELLRIENEKRREDEKVLAERVQELELANEDLAFRFASSPKKARKR